MACAICNDLERSLKLRRNKYIESLSSAYYQVSTQLAAQTNVDIERAESDLKQHRLVCIFPVEESLEQMAEDERLIEYLQKRHLAETNKR